MMLGQNWGFKMLIEKLLKQVEKDIRIYPQHVNRISSVGFPCLRNCVYQRTNWMDKKPPSVGLQLIFNEGRHQERAVKRDLEAAGVDVLQAEAQVWFEKEKLSGHVDGIIMSRKKQIPIEIKSMDDHLFDKIKTIEDLNNSDMPYLKCYVPQLQLYMYGFGAKKGLILIKFKSKGKLKEFEVKLDKRLCKKYLKKCMDINAWIDNNFLPDRINHMPTCNHCNFNHICLPDQIREEQIKLYTESWEFIQQLIDREELHERQDRKSVV